LTLVLCEAAARFVVYLAKPSLCSNRQWDDKYLVAKTLNVHEDNIVLCGSSLSKQGFYPELITNRLKKINPNVRVTNLAANAGNQLDAVDMLEYLRQWRSIKPKAVVFDMEVANFALPRDATNSQGDRAQSYLFKGCLSRPTNFWQNLQLFAEDTSWLIRYRGGLKHLVMNYLSILGNFKELDRSGFYMLSDVNDFGVSLSGMSPDQRLLMDADWDEQQRRMSTSFKGSPKSGDFHYHSDVYSIIIEYCQKQHVPLILVWLPHQSSVYKALWYKAPYTEDWFRSKFEEFAKQDGVYPVYLNKLPLDYALYTDYRHLSNYGCVKASELFAETLLSPQYRFLIQ
jgi:hypothetical protein